MLSNLIPNFTVKIDKFLKMFYKQTRMNSLQTGYTLMQIDSSYAHCLLIDFKNELCDNCFLKYIFENNSNHKNSNYFNN